MFRLSQIILLVISLSIFTLAQTPHGNGLKLDCSVCHNSSDWKVDFKTNKFDHSLTQFPLVGQHKTTNCRSCHTDLVFENALSECSSCHTDIHQETVGLDCSRCHTPASWIVEDINGLHQTSRFPLLGQHLSADCAQCHSRYTDLYFEPLDVDCFSCHKENYMSTTFPNHVEAGFSTDCQICHSINALDWAGASIIHDFFPLVGGHAIQDCFACHNQGGDFTGLSPECYSCHQQDYESTTDPNHVTANFPTNCTLCHTIYGWSPASFDHNQTAFPLIGKHATLDCTDCHSNGYTGTPTDCFSCHETDFNGTNDPPHQSLGFSHKCTDCHNQNGWSPANFDHNFYRISNHNNVNCNECHSATNYQPQCLSCHHNDFNRGHDPGNRTDCWNCHSTSNWDSGGD